ncbi:uncharacterized protein LOC116850178 [Odontomachus brunneus]|uniref:uncharacterized protein LOC116850178 n=1 Tax=Odontomachus brunneus TaxID=486640 RepID=UPI0013F25A6C|nr:uncharacterized protein LOC116850178 [Odontomachus brunneus]
MSTENEVKRKRFYWKNKLVTEKVYKNRIRLKEVGKNLQKVRTRCEGNLQPRENVREKKTLEGRRIVDLNSLGKNLICQSCGSILSLLDIEDEECKGLASLFTIKCRKCSKKTRVASDKHHVSSTNNKESNHFDVNTRAVIGVLNSGSGNTHLNKILAALDVPLLHPNVYKVHEKEVGRAMEELATESCKEAAILERNLTIEKADELKLLL